MKEELDAMDYNNTWSVVKLPTGKQPIGCRWIYKVKYSPNGSVSRYIARLVAQGFTQHVGIDYLETFSPVAKLTTVRVLLSIATAKNWNLLQLDINNAFLNGDLFEEVYMQLPLEYPTPKVISEGEQLVCRLNKSIYGLKQASRQWFTKISTALLQHGFTQSKCDYSLFHKGFADSLVVLLVYVNDIILARPNFSILTTVKSTL